MQTNQKPDWEGRLDRELKALPTLRAPASIRVNVMAALRARAATPWYQRGWQSWPAGLQYASITALMLILVGAYWALGQVEQPDQFARWAGQGNEALSLVKSLLAALAALGDSIVILLGKLGKPTLISLAIAGVLGYAMCLALGTVYFRLAMARRP
jgi:hypothetical protein